ncbi:flagellar basal-body MS-ring/collar protein FliF [Calditerrivibrio nitroreducens]|uniref:Flagellar M-ring protein n=1 Tax=Calditerrivibrio nitroreducens (strain DSM 19672 / NBRC 101217 / Yu37-1) TaxID=768670 RepID=E4TGA5_CALNY|nr:flagellar basal-body MS-ring/collar protein FliF [Calditerrivibrio nitroreducens]ADR19692.1 flagellar M-ring protein FliF [Calditerrivibrio nitroreducens DSM 19672]
MNLKDVGEQFKTVFQKFSKVQQIAIISAAVAILLSIIVLVYWANKPVYKILFANLSQEDAAEVVAKLKAKKIPYNLKDSGKTIEVPAKDVYETRIELAKEGIPKGGGVGFELFDKTSFGITEFAQNVNYQRALQGELSRTISTLEEVEEARVHLTLPKDKLFITEDGEAKAAVVLKLKKGETLNRDKVKAIASLVVGAVKGLKIQNVQIVDTQGNLLSESLNEENLPYVKTQTQLEYQKKVEKIISSKINSLLATTLGENNAVAQVTAEIDFDKKEINKEEFDQNPVLRSSQTIEIESKNTPNTPQGQPGVEPNLAEPNIQQNGVNSTYTKNEETQNFEIGKTVTKEEKSIGSIKRLTIAVVVNDKAEIVKEGKKEVTKYVPRTKEELDKIKGLVAKAAGFDEKRGDQIEVTNVSFDTSQMSESKLLEKEKMNELIIQISKYVMVLVMFLLFYFLVIRPIMKKLGDIKETKSGELAAVGDIPLKGANVDLQLDDSVKFPKTLEELEREIESELDEKVSVDVGTVKTKVMVKKIEEAVKEDPEMIANLIKTWLKE